MIIEFSAYDQATSNEELKSILNKIKHIKVDTICVFLNHIKLAKDNLPEHIKISTPIDYPLGILDTKTRISAIESSIKQGAQIINVVAPTQYLCNRKYDKLRDDIKQISELCLSNNIILRYILEYRIFSYDLLYKVSQILSAGGVDTIYPSTGFFLDDINDNIVASALINKKSPINIICNGNIWNNDQIKKIYKSQLFGIKVNSINALKLLQENKLNS
jgi:deoxyribose-phosphate aldolase